MSRRAAKDPTAWRRTANGRAEYQGARARAQENANASGLDYGIEAFDYTEWFHVFMLPRRENRQGHELRCEFVSCETLDRCAPGHGPAGGADAGR